MLGIPAQWRPTVKHQIQGRACGGEGLVQQKEKNDNEVEGLFMDAGKRTSQKIRCLAIPPSKYSISTSVDGSHMQPSSQRLSDP